MVNEPRWRKDIPRDLEGRKREQNGPEQEKKRSA